ncbi:nose resistant to fluoxetine protein 6 [Trichonephila clavipes]|nr:nose resistant to fluoxetine protein 6 [Trichonephila clavipes]
MLNETIYDEYVHQNDFIKAIQEIKNRIRVSKNLEIASSENTDFLNESKHVFPKSTYTIFDFLIDANSSKCYQDLKYVFQNLVDENWANEMLDSFGKPESGILQGNLKWLGNYDQCLKVYAPPDNKTEAGDFHGKYCLLHIPSAVHQIMILLNELSKIRGSHRERDPGLGPVGPRLKASLSVDS